LKKKKREVERKKKKIFKPRLPHTDIETDRKRAIKKKIKKYLDG
jgi:hypothetical protein